MMLWCIFWIAFKHKTFHILHSNFWRANFTPKNLCANFRQKCIHFYGGAKSHTASKTACKGIFCKIRSWMCYNVWKISWRTNSQPSVTLQQFHWTNLNRKQNKNNQMKQHMLEHIHGPCTTQYTCVKFSKVC